MRSTWRLLTGRRDLRLVLSAGIISLTGDWILTIGLIYRVYAMTGSTVASALTMASSFAPQSAEPASRDTLDTWPFTALAVRSSWSGTSRGTMACWAGYVAVWPAVAGMIIVGLPGALTLAGLITLFQRGSEDSYRAGSSAPSVPWKA